MTEVSKKRVPSRSGHCSEASPTHSYCYGEWETPSVIGVCQCECHKEITRKIVPKVSKEKSAKVSARVLVPKK